ncbi:hypothetical protein SEA_ALONE_136 [Streptomyces phage Alone3]|nr:hypothetical protein SEA_ALONE_136 [Streptomyces phage Alone3]
MTRLNKDEREFMGIPIEGDIPFHHSRRSYVPKDIEELYPHFKEEFYKGIKAVTWHQYTPYFNDGEPCEFSVYDLCVTSNEEVAEHWVNGDFYEDRLVEVSKEDYDAEKAYVAQSSYRYFPYEEIDGKYYKRYEEGTYDYIPGPGHPDGITDVDIPIHKLEFEDALRTKFGDHTQVVVTPGRVVQFDYEHD